MYLFFYFRSVTYLYWSDWGSPSKIERLQLDDSLSLVVTRRQIVSSQLLWPNGLTVDCKKERLYWADAKLKKIEVSDLLVSAEQLIKTKFAFGEFVVANSLFMV